ncbi:MAG: aminoacyl-tRNA hydrolase [Actinomycetota bacterium]|nr:aminoacyl-tRNA hydrolase [Actinomycetota bacterium]
MAADDLVVRPGLTIPGHEIDERFSTSGGPGGQHANKTATRVELRYDIAGSAALDDHQRRVLVDAFGDEVRVVVDDERSQLRNRGIARERLAGRLANALVPQRTRRPTRPTMGSKRRRLDAKRQRGETKQNRRRPQGEH